MPDEPITTPVANSPEAAVQPSQETVPATPVGAQVEQEPEPESGFTSEDFKNPQYGAKAKQLYRGWQKRQGESKEWEKKYRDVEAIVKGVPEVNKAFKDWYAKQTGQVMEEQPSNETPPAVDPHEVVSSQMAFHDVYAQLGKGDPITGRDTFEREYKSEIEKIAGTFAGSDVGASLRLAMELINLRKGGIKTAEPPTPPASSERGRGATSVPPKQETDPFKIAESTVREMGYSSLTELFNAGG